MKKITAVLVVAAMGGSALAGLTATYNDMGNLSKDVLSQTNSLTVAEGDVVVMVAASNKKNSVAPISFASTAGTFIGLGANDQLGNNPNPDAYLSYLTITTGGTYDFIGSYGGGGIAANLGVYKLSAGSGVIELAANNAKKYGGLPVGESLSVTNFMNWGANPNAADYDGIVTIGVASSLKGSIANTNSIGGFILDEDNASKRLVGSSDRTGNSNVKHIWDITAASSIESGGITGAAFAEVIPEPATLGIVVFSGTAILFIRRRFMM